MEMPGSALMVIDAAHYSAVERLPNARRLEIRAFKSDDRADFLSAVDRIGPSSLYRRFFAVKRHFTERACILSKR